MILSDVANLFTSIELKDLPIDLYNSTADLATRKFQTDNSGRSKEKHLFDWLQATKFDYNFSSLHSGYLNTSQDLAWDFAIPWKNSFLKVESKHQPNPIKFSFIRPKRYEVACSHWRNYDILVSWTYVPESNLGKINFIASPKLFSVEYDCLWKYNGINEKSGSHFLVNQIPKTLLYELR